MMELLVLLFLRVGGGWWVLKFKLMLNQPPTELELELGLSLAIYKNYIFPFFFFFLYLVCTIL